MVTFTAIEEGIYVDQWCVSPTVYLDHWAWRKISEAEILAARFSTALKSSGGTLALSWLNLVEFSKVTAEYRHQAAKADALLEIILPNVFFLDPDFHKVIDRENELQHGGERSAPHADLDSLRGFVMHNFRKTNSLKLLPELNLFRLVSATDLAPRFDALADKIVGSIQALREEYQSDRTFRLGVKKPPKGKPIQCGTRFMARELLGSLLVDSRLPLDRNHASDVSHAIVAAAYCDYVLLDGHWAEQVERARRRIAEGGLSFPVAAVFSERANGIEKFLQSLESAGHAPHLTR